MACFKLYNKGILSDILFYWKWSTSHWKQPRSCSLSLGIYSTQDIVVLQLILALAMNLLSIDLTALACL